MAEAGAAATAVAAGKMSHGTSSKVLLPNGVCGQCPVLNKMVCADTAVARPAGTGARPRRGEAVRLRPAAAAVRRRPAAAAPRRLVTAVTG